MATTLTTRSGFILPDNAEIIDVIGDLNPNWTKLDTSLDRVCTSSTRPSTAYIGMRAFETDTNTEIVCIGVAPIVWRYLSAPVVASVAARNALTPVFAGLQCIRSDKGWMETYDGTAWRVPGYQTVAALADITNPITNQLALLSSDTGIYRYTGSAWLFIESTSPTAGTVQYKRTTSFTVASSAVTKLSFDTPVDVDTTSVTVAGGQDFTLVRGGKWAAGCNIPWYTTNGASPFSPPAAASVWAWIGLTSDSTPPGRRVVASGAETGSFQTVLAPNKTMRFTAGTVLSVWVYQDKNISRDIAFGQAPIDVTFTYLGP